MRKYLYAHSLLCLFIYSFNTYAKDFNYKNIVLGEDKINSNLVIVYPKTDYYTLSSTSSTTKPVCEDIHTKLNTIAALSSYKACLADSKFTGCDFIYEQLNDVRYDNYPTNRDAAQIWSISPNSSLSNNDISEIKKIVSNMENNIDVNSIQYVKNNNYKDVTYNTSSIYSDNSLEKILSELPYLPTDKSKAQISLSNTAGYLNTYGTDIYCDLIENQATINGWSQNVSYGFSGKLASSQDNFKLALNSYQTQFNDVSQKTSKFTSLSNENIVKAAVVGAILGSVQNTLNPNAQDDIKSIQIKGMYDLFVNSSDFSTIYPLDSDRFNTEDNVTTQSNITVYLGVNQNSGVMN